MMKLFNLLFVIFMKYSVTDAIKCYQGESDQYKEQECVGPQYSPVNIVLNACAKVDIGGALIRSCNMNVYLRDALFQGKYPPAFTRQIFATLVLTQGKQYTFTF